MTIAQIHQAAKDAPPGPLDHPAHLERDIGLPYYTNYNLNSKCFYLDVPLVHIVSLARDFVSLGDTWREATSRLNGVGWTTAVLPYFSSQIMDVWFPAPGAANTLRLEAIGGACNCTNGMHRLVAARAWLTFNNIDHLKAVRVTVRPVHAELIPLLQRAQAQGAYVRVAYVKDLWIPWATQNTVMLFSSEAEPGLVYDWDGVKLHGPRRYGVLSLLRITWRVTPARVVADMLDDGWIRSQLGVAQTCS